MYMSPIYNIFSYVTLPYTMSTNQHCDKQTEDIAGFLHTVWETWLPVWAAVDNTRN